MLIIKKGEKMVQKSNNQEYFKNTKENREIIMIEKYSWLCWSLWIPDYFVHLSVDFGFFRETFDYCFYSISDLQNLVSWI